MKRTFGDVFDFETSGNLLDWVRFLSISIRNFISVHKEKQFSPYCFNVILAMFTAATPQIMWPGGGSNTIEREYCNYCILEHECCSLE